MKSAIKGPIVLDLTVVTAVFINIGRLFTCLYVGNLQIFIADFVVTVSAKFLGIQQDPIRWALS